LGEDEARYTSGSLGSIDHGEFLSTSLCGEHVEGLFDAEDVFDVETLIVVDGPASLLVDKLIRLL